jgi:pyridoxamine 5'-phosphate oxidase
MNDKIKHLRQEYSHATLLEHEIEQNPFFQFKKWLEDAMSVDLPEPHAMTISTVAASGKPSARIVLLRHFDEAGFTFYTNYASKKALDLNQNPYAALNFFWQQIERQVRIEGTIQKVSSLESDTYFASRPRESQIGAWASAQSQLITDRKELEDKVKFYTDKFEAKPIPRPEQWGGFRIVPDYFEFWQGRPSRLHDRISYTLQNKVWLMCRLNP